MSVVFYKRETIINIWANKMFTFENVRIKIRKNDGTEASANADV